MLTLLTSPRWAPQGQPPRPLPVTLPAALLVVLAAQGDWMTRERLAVVFWPNAAPADALHHLRVNLHRARALLSTWDQADALLAERTRLKLVLPSDLQQWRAAQAAGQAALLARSNPAHWLQGFRLPDHEGFMQWADDMAQQLQEAWLRANQASNPSPSGAPHGVAATAPVTPESSAAQPSAPPGRDAEQLRLLASGAPALLLLGDPGAGKTTLLRATWPLAPCLRGLEGLHAMPYRPLLDTLREHIPVLQRALRQPQHPLRPYRLDLARVLPELAPDEPLPALDALTARSRLVEALARAFESLTPVLLVDDLQWCDAATVEWLLMLAHSGRLRWRAAARRHEMGDDLVRALQSLRSASRLDDLDLALLDRAALNAVCQARWPQLGFSAAQLDHLLALSGGNPFLLGELVAAGMADATAFADDSAPQPLQAQVQQLVLARLSRLHGPARQVVEAAAVLVQAVPMQALQAVAGGPRAAAAAVISLQWESACEQALAAGLLDAEAPSVHPGAVARLTCRHDLIRQAVAATLPAARLAVLHRQAAMWLAQQPDSDSLLVAEHWNAAQEPQTALAWQHRGAEQLKSRGRFDEARALWRRVAEESLDAAQALRARLELAACDIFEDLTRGETALEAVQAQLAAVADTEQRRQIEGRVLAALVDNRVFAGDISRATVHAARLRELLPALPGQEQADVLEVLIELAMRQPDIDGAWAFLAQLRNVAPRRPSLLSFEGQIHWFGGQVRAAHDALARLLERHPEFCRGITVENDLAVMLHALGELTAAETMARRSLQSWAGVVHTETLSLLVLGSVLTSAGRHMEADAVLQRALALAREQGSAGFEAEAQVRHARLWLQCGRVAAAQAALDAAAPLLQSSPEPLRVSQWALAQVLAATAAGAAVPPWAWQRLQAAAQQSPHPLVQVRRARADNERAALQADWPAAAQAAAQMADTARRAGLQEPLAEAWLLQARAGLASGEPLVDTLSRAAESAALAQRMGFAELAWRANSWLARHGDAKEAPAWALVAQQAGRGLAQGDLFDELAAARREPRWA